MSSKLKIKSLSEFRKNAASLTDWVAQDRRRIWITRHGKVVCAVVSLDRLETLEKLEWRPRGEDRERYAEHYLAWKRAKGLGLSEADDRDWREWFEEVGEGERGF